jgi:hypothetical protein
VHDAAVVKKISAKRARRLYTVLGVVGLIESSWSL